MRIWAARRWGAVAVVSALLVLVGIASPAAACACGVIAPQTDATAAFNGERAIINWDGERQQIDLTLNMASDAASAGLIFPTPSPATVTAGDLDRFEHLERQIAPQAIVVNDWWGFGVPGETPVTDEPRVLNRVTVGDLEATTLKASNVSGLNRWLKTNDYSLSTASRESLATYVSLGWSFVAVKLTASATLDGALEPIRFTFDTDELVYPVRASSTASNSQDIRLYIFDDHRVSLNQFERSNRPVNASQTVVWAGDVSNSSVSDSGAYLTVFDLHIDNPKTQVRSDILIVDALADDEVIPTTVRANPITLLGIPVGLLVVGWLGFGIILLLSYIVGRFRSH